MKTKNIILLIAFSFLFLTHTQAQISAGGGLGYNEQIAGPGLTLKGVIDITDNIAISPSASYFFGSSLFGFNQNVIAVDANAHYYFNIIEDKLNVYPVAGFNFSRYKIGVSNFLGVDAESATENAFGANIGAGATYQFTEKLKAYLEPKYVISNFDQIIVNVGILVNL